MKWQRWRKWGLIAVAMMLAVAIYFPSNGRGESAPAAVAAAKPSVHKQPQQDSRVELERLERKKETGGTSVGDAFSPTSWYVAPPPPPPAPLPPPTAPPMPFTYVGRYQDSAGEVVMLARGDRLYTVNEGTEIDGTYRVKHIGSNVVDLVYLPMNIDQSISTADSSADAQSQSGAIRRP